MLAGRAGVGTSIVQKLEQDARHSVRLGTLTALAGVLKVPVGALLGDQAAAEPEPQAGASERNERCGPTLLRVLLTERHWQKFETFEAKFTHAAAKLSAQEGAPRLARLTVSSRQFERWYAGNVKTGPHPDACRVLEHMFGYPVSKLLAPADDVHAPPRLPPELGELNEYSETEEVSATRRRDFAAIGGYTLAGHVVGMLEREHDLMHMTLDRGTTSEERVAHLEGVAEDLGVEVGKVAQLTVLDPALTALRSVRAVLAERQPTNYQVRLVRTSARLSTVLGEIMFNVGRFRQAHEWYKTAEHAAFDVGDRYLADIALGGQAYLPTYSDDPHGVLTLLAPRLEGQVQPSPATAFLWGLKARAHATLNEPDDFSRSIEHAQECLVRSSAELIRPSIFSFRPAKLAFYEATGSVLLNDPGRAVDAADRALSLDLLSEVINPALTRLQRASALAQSGEVPEACRVATEAILDPKTYHAVTVRAFARKFEELLRGIQSPETREWRELRAEVHA